MLFHVFYQARLPLPHHLLHPKTLFSFSEFPFFLFQCQQSKVRIRTQESSTTAALGSDFTEHVHPAFPHLGHQKHDPIQGTLYTRSRKVSVIIPCRVNSGPLYWFLMGYVLHTKKHVDGDTKIRETKRAYENSQIIRFGFGGAYFNLEASGSVNF